MLLGKETAADMPQVAMIKMARRWSPWPNVVPDRAAGSSAQRTAKLRLQRMAARHDDMVARMWIAEEQAALSEYKAAKIESEQFDLNSLAYGWSKARVARALRALREMEVALPESKAMEVTAQTITAAKAAVQPSRSLMELPVSGRTQRHVETDENVSLSQQSAAGNQPAASSSSSWVFKPLSLSPQLVPGVEPCGPMTGLLRLPSAARVPPALQVPVVTRPEPIRPHAH